MKCICVCTTEHTYSRLGQGNGMMGPMPASTLQLTLQQSFRGEEKLSFYGGLLMAESYQFLWVPSC